MGIDLLSASGHKIHGPKGVGFLYVDSRVKIHPILFGGGQQRDLRSGTENVPGIAGLGLASKMIYQDLEMKTALMRELKAYFIKGLEEIGDTTVHGVTDDGSAPHIVSAGIAGVRSEVLLHTLEDKGIYVSSGSACSSNHPAVSGVLKAIGAPREYLDATLRFSMSEFTTKEKLTTRWKHYIIVYRCFGNLHGAEALGKAVTGQRACVSAGNAPAQAEKEITMTFHSFLIKYGEIGIKGKNRYMFEDALVRQIRYALKDVEGEFLVHKCHGRVYVDCEGEYDYEETVESLKKVFGIVGICPL